MPNRCSICWRSLAIHWITRRFDSSSWNTATSRCLIKEQRLLQPDTWNGLQGPIEHWIESKITWEPQVMFHGMPRGRYWEVVVDGRPQFIQDALIRTTVASPFRMKLSSQVALLLYVYGPLSPASVARGLDVSEQQAKGAAAALSRKDLIVKGKEPYTSKDPTRAAFRYWLHQELGDRMPAWMKEILRNPEMLKQRAIELKRRKD